MNQNLIMHQEAATKLAHHKLAEGYEVKALHLYCDESGNEEYVKIRLEHAKKEKWVRPMHADSNGVYRLGDPEKFTEALKPLYGLHHLKQRPNAKIIIVEGESVADSLNEFIANKHLDEGYLAITSGSATSVTIHDWSHLSNRKCLLWPDHDECGHKYMHDIAEKLQENGCSFELINVSQLGLPKGGDFIDWHQLHPEATIESIYNLPRNNNYHTLANHDHISAPSLSETLDAIAVLIRDHIICEEDTVIAATLWIAMTWMVEHIQIAPLAIITAPDKRCGKSTLLTLLSKLVKAPMLASNITPAALFRSIEAFSPTLLIDETDTFINASDDMRGILNCGHSRDAAYIIRSVGRDHTPTKFNVFGAKALSGIGKQADTLMDRGVILTLRRKLVTERVKKIRHTDHRIFEDISNQMESLSQTLVLALKTSRPILPDSLNDREQDSWEPLLAIADIAGSTWPNKARIAACNLCKEPSVSQSIELLIDIQTIFKTHIGDRIATKDLILLLCEDDEMRWSSYNYGKAISALQLAQILKEFKIKSKTIRRETGTIKGYMKNAFNDVFDRYLPAGADTPVTT